jgi:pyruvate dehydrogenase E2 component (dihydrolipoamide acetyltransferase)
VAEFLMPILGSDMTAGTLLAWRKQAGEVVRRGDVIAEVETDKADIEVESFLSGVLEKLLVQPGAKVPVGTPLAIIREEGAPTAAEAPAGPPPPVAPVAAPPPVPAPAPPVAPPALPDAAVRATPVARKLAAELSVDLASVTGTGPGGRIQERDVREAAAAVARTAAAAQPTPPVDRQARMRQAIAAAMARSAREIPHFHLLTTIEMSRALAWLVELNAKRSVADRLLYGALLIKAVARAVGAVPELNAVWANGTVVPKPDVHVGVAITLRGGGLVAPALHHTDRLSLDELMQQFRDLVQRARAGSLRSSELADPTITVTSLGEQGVETVFGLIYPPQVALVGFGKIVERPWAVDGQVVPRPLVAASLAADHRVVDGHRGSVFLATIDRLLQEPSEL